MRVVGRSVSQTSHHLHHGPHGVDAHHHRELLELEFEEEILELSGYHHRPPSLVGHVNSAYTGFLPFGDSASSIATASPPPLLPPLPPAAASAASTLVLGNQFSETTYYKLTAGTPQSTTSRGSRGSRGSNSSKGRKASDATKEEIQDDDDEEASLRELLMRCVRPRPINSRFVFLSLAGSISISIFFAGPWPGRSPPTTTFLRVARRGKCSRGALGRRVRGSLPPLRLTERRAIIDPAQFHPLLSAAHFLEMQPVAARWSSYFLLLLQIDSRRPFCFWLSRLRGR